MPYGKDGIKQLKKDHDDLKKNPPKIVVDKKTGIHSVEIWSNTTKGYISVAEYTNPRTAQTDMKMWQKDHKETLVKIMKLSKDVVKESLDESFKKGQEVVVNSKTDDYHLKVGEITKLGRGKSKGVYVVKFPNGQRSSYNEDELEKHIKSKDGDVWSKNKDRSVTFKESLDESEISLNEVFDSKYEWKKVDPTTWAFGSEEENQILLLTINKETKNGMNYQFVGIDDIDNLKSGNFGKVTGKGNVGKVYGTAIDIIKKNIKLDSKNVANIVLKGLDRKNSVLFVKLAKKLGKVVTHVSSNFVVIYVGKTEEDAQKAAEIKSKDFGRGFALSEEMDDDFETLSRRLANLGYDEDDLIGFDTAGDAPDQMLSNSKNFADTGRNGLGIGFESILDEELMISAGDKVIIKDKTSDFYGKKGKVYKVFKATKKKPEGYTVKIGNQVISLDKDEIEPVNPTYTMKEASWQDNVKMAKYARLGESLDEGLRLPPDVAKKLAGSVAGKAKGKIIPFVQRFGDAETTFGYTDAKGKRNVVATIDRKVSKKETNDILKGIRAKYEVNESLNELTGIIGGLESIELIVRGLVLGARKLANGDIVRIVKRANKDATIKKMASQLAKVDGAMDVMLNPNEKAKQKFMKDNLSSKDYKKAHDLLRRISTETIKQSSIDESLKLVASKGFTRDEKDKLVNTLSRLKGAKFDFGNNDEFIVTYKGKKMKLTKANSQYVSQIGNNVITSSSIAGAVLKHPKVTVFENTNYMSKKERKDTISEMVKESANTDSAKKFKELEKMMKSHDWTYEMSDDHRAWKKGADESKAMTKLSTELQKVDRKRVDQLWKKYGGF